MEDISAELDLEFEEKIFLLGEILSIPNRTYLWVTLMMDVVQNIVGFTRGNVKKCIKNLPRSVDEAYEKILDRSREVGKTKKLLRIIIAAQRPLSLAEISLAMAIEEHHTCDEDIEQEPEQRFRRTIRDLCGLFVIIVDSRIYLLHQTAREFLMRTDMTGCSSQETDIRSELRWRHSITSSDSHLTLAGICVRSLHFFYPTRFMEAFLDYSSIYWDLHLRESDVQRARNIAPRAVTLCTPGSSQYELWKYASLRTTHTRIDRDMTPLAVASSFGLKPVAKFLIDEGMGVNAADAKGQTAMCFAALEGRTSTIAMLLAHGADPDLSIKRFPDSAPLLAAIDTNQEDMVDLLLTAGADVNFPSRGGRTPLIVPSCGGYSGIVSQLIRAGARVNDSDCDGRAPLSWAAGNIHPEDKVAVAKFLIAAGAEIDAKDINGATALWYAAKGKCWSDTKGFSSSEGLVQILLDNGADATVKAYRDMSAMSIARSRGHKNIAQLLGEHQPKTPQERNPPSALM